MNPSIFSTRAVSPLLRLLLIGAVLGVFERTLLLFSFFFLALVTTTEAAATAAGFVSGVKERDRRLRRDDVDVMTLSFGVAGVQVVTTTCCSLFFSAAALAADLDEKRTTVQNNIF